MINHLCLPGTILVLTLTIQHPRTLLSPRPNTHIEARRTKRADNRLYWAAAVGCEELVATPTGVTTVEATAVPKCKTFLGQKTLRRPDIWQQALSGSLSWPQEERIPSWNQTVVSGVAREANSTQLSSRLRVTVSRASLLVKEASICVWSTGEAPGNSQMLLGYSLVWGAKPSQMLVAAYALIWGQREKCHPTWFWPGMVGWITAFPILPRIYVLISKTYQC